MAWVDVFMQIKLITHKGRRMSEKVKQGLGHMTLSRSWDLLSLCLFLSLSLCVSISLREC